MPDLLFILLLALVVFGPKRLPQIAAQAAKLMRQFQSMKREMLEGVKVEIARLEPPKQATTQLDGSGRAGLQAGVPHTS